MRELTEQRDAYRKPEGVSKGRRGLLIVNTGHGKGKTTAALGLMIRAHGRGLRVRMFQFLKHDTAKFGEHRTLDLLGIPYQGLGDGWTWRSRDLENSAALAEHGWALARAAIQSGEHDLIVLDEFTYPSSTAGSPGPTWKPPCAPATPACTWSSPDVTPCRNSWPSPTPSARSSRSGTPTSKASAGRPASSTDRGHSGRDGAGHRADARRWGSGSAL